jgi:hypothetical protein
VTADASAGTTNLDYFDNYFKGNATTNWDATNLGQGRPIPGACRRIWVPWTADVLVLGTLMCGNTSAAENDRTFVYMTIDGTFVDDQRRSVRRSLATLTGAIDLHRGSRRNRSWQPIHLAEGVTEGWHDFGLSILGNEAVEMNRVWARHMIVVPFKA